MDCAYTCTKSYVSEEEDDVVFSWWWLLLESHLQRAESRAETSVTSYEWSLLGRPFDLLATTLFVLPVPIID